MNKCNVSLLEPKNVLKTVNKPSTPSLTIGSIAPTAPAAFQQHTVDHRPTKLLVSGYETDEQDSVLSHFQVSLSKQKKKPMECNGFQ